jgi:hypothetical protein
MGGREVDGAWRRAETPPQGRVQAIAVNLYGNEFCLSVAKRVYGADVARIFDPHLVSRAQEDSGQEIERLLCA